MQPEVRVMSQNMIYRHRKEIGRYDIKRLLSSHLNFDVSNCLAHFINGYMSEANNKEVHIFTDNIFIRASEIYIDFCQKKISRDEAKQKSFNLGLITARNIRSEKLVAGRKLIEIND